MAYRLGNLVPWGRNLDEYTKMFGLSETELNSKIAGFGDGPASFNAECCRRGGHVVSFDPIYRYPAEKVFLCLCEAKRQLLEDVGKNRFHDLKTAEKTVDEIETHHREATRTFLDDFERGKTEGRYIDHALPYRIPFPDGSFDLGLSSHFLLQYTKLGFNFHIQSLEEMLRTCHEIRIFPTVDSNGRKTPLTEKLLDHFAGDHEIALPKTRCHFMNGAHEMLVIRKKEKGRKALLN